MVIIVKSSVESGSKNRDIVLKPELNSSGNLPWTGGLFVSPSEPSNHVFESSTNLLNSTKSIAPGGGELVLCCEGLLPRFTVWSHNPISVRRDINSSPRVVESDGIKINFNLCTMIVKR